MRRLSISLGVTFWVCAMFRVEAATSLAYRIPSVADPADPIVVFLDLTSDRSNIAAIGSRMTYGATKLSLASVEVGAGVPASWSIIFQDVATPGQVDVAITDQTAAAATVSTPASSEVVKLTFSRIGTGCSQAAFDFNSAAPGAGAAAAAFPVNHYAIYVSTTIVAETATTTPASGPVTLNHAFLRGNVNNRAAHAIDIQDVVDLVATLFGGFAPSFDCQAAFDVDNDGAQNISDVVGLVQGIFGTTGYTIPPPTTSPGIVVPDGGTIPSVLGCNEGESC
jgi:hypothetical protein